MESADQCPQSLFSLSISTLDTLPSGQASNTLTNTANVLQIGISEKLGIFLQFTALMITAVIIAFTYSWSLTLVTSSLLLFIGTVYGIIIPLVVKRNKEVEHADEKASSIAGEVLGSIRMIVACGAEGRVARKYSGWIQESLRRGLRLSPLIGIQFAPCKLAMDRHLYKVNSKKCSSHCTRRWLYAFGMGSSSIFGMILTVFRPLSSF
jgi:ATP-binding cassette, subfamily B (MDR/TAP), member 1